MFTALVATLTFTASQITEIIVASVGAVATVTVAAINNKD